MFSYKKSTNEMLVLDPLNIAKNIYQHLNFTNVVSHKLFVKDILVLCESFEISSIGDEYYSQSILLLKDYMFDFNNETLVEKKQTIPDLTFLLTIIVSNSSEIKLKESFLEEFSNISLEYQEAWPNTNSNVFT